MLPWWAPCDSLTQDVKQAVVSGLQGVNCFLVQAVLFGIILHTSGKTTIQKHLVVSEKHAVGVE